MIQRQGGASRRPGSRKPAKPSRYGQQNPRGVNPLPPFPTSQRTPRPPQPRATSGKQAGDGAIFADRWPSSPTGTQKAGDVAPASASKRKKDGPFKVLIAVHRPRYRGRTERACAIGGWQVTSLLNKQDVVGFVQKSEGPPDLVILSSDFGRQKSLGIFKAIQQMRPTGMKIVGLIVDEEGLTTQDGIPAEKLCDVSIAPPYKAADLRTVFCKLYEDIRGVPVAAEVIAEGIDQESEDEE